MVAGHPDLLASYISQGISSAPVHLPPLLFERAEHPKIHPPVPQETCLTQYALFHESQTAWNRAAPEIPRRASDLHPMKTVIAKGARDHRPARARHDPAAGPRLVQPVPNAGSPVQRVDRMQSNRARYIAPMAHYTR